MRSGTYCFSLDYAFITIRTNRRGARVLNNILWCHCKIEHRHMGAISVDKRNGNGTSCKTNVSISILTLYYIFICRYFIWYLCDRQSFTRLLYIPLYSISVQLSVDKINNLSQYFKRSASVCTWTFIDTSKRDEKLKQIKTHVTLVYFWSWVNTKKYRE